MVLHFIWSDLIFYQVLKLFSSNFEKTQKILHLLNLEDEEKYLVAKITWCLLKKNSNLTK